MDLPVLRCSHCGAEVTPPADAELTFATCIHCGLRLPLPPEWVQARAAQRLAEARQRHEMTEARAKGRERGMRLVGCFLIGATVTVVGAVIGVVFWRQLAKQAQADQRAVVAQQRMAELKTMTVALEQHGCTHTVRPPEALVGQVELSLTMRAGGNCLHALATGAGKLDARMLSPSGKAGKVTGRDQIELEYCATESGEHRFVLDNPEERVVAVTLVDCPPAFEAHQNDPERNGLKRAQEYLKVLQREGCGRVILPPRAVTGEQSLTAQMNPGRFCSVLIATAGADDNLLDVTIESPLGEIVNHHAPAPRLEIAHCGTVMGDHTVKVKPTTLDYYTLAGMECPKHVAIAHGAK